MTTAADPETLYDIAARHGFSNAATAAALAAVRRGLRGMAQFDHPDLGGRGQWMAGGMTQVGGDRSLRDRVAALFADVAQFAVGPAVDVQRTQMEPMKPMSPMKPMAPMKPMEPMRGSAIDAPADWGQPSTAGGQNDVRYAYFDGPHRLVVERGGQRNVYDTAGRRITGVAQDQSDAAAGRVTFTTADGTVDVASLKQV